jgi:EAL domain-containing protein (putative c-di-GMP-specific phosphodiesterase class I)
VLELEITETIAMYNIEQVLAILELLRDMGVRVAIDDFGTGYSSMSYLKKFPVQTLKLAQDFMRDVEVDSQSAAIASMLIDLSRELGLDLVVEGVENENQLQFLKDRGCYVIQGYFFSRPVPSQRLCDMLRRGVSAEPQLPTVAASEVDRLKRASTSEIAPPPFLAPCAPAGWMGEQATDVGGVSA